MFIYGHVSIAQGEMVYKLPYLIAWSSVDIGWSLWFIWWKMDDTLKPCNAHTFGWECGWTNLYGCRGGHGIGLVNDAFVIANQVA